MKKERFNMQFFFRPWITISGGLLVAVCAIGIALTRTVQAQPTSIIQIKDMSQMEIKSAGFSIPSATKIRIHALGGGTRRSGDDNYNLFAYGWIINADTRQPVWRMTYENTSAKGDDRAFDDELDLPAGDYEVYFTAYGFSGGSAFGKITLNIDRRHLSPDNNRSRDGGFFSWLEDMFSAKLTKGWNNRVKNWGIEISLPQPTTKSSSFIPPKPFPHLLYSSTGIGEHAYIRQGFALRKPVTLRIYAIGEEGSDGELVDFGWITDTKTHKRVWEMRTRDTEPAGGASKNVMVDENVRFEPGDYLVSYISDNSHSFVDWNSAPPSDPLNYGISLMSKEQTGKDVFALNAPKEDENVIVNLTRIGNNQTRSESFTLKEDASVRIYAVGERTFSGKEMADRGWIINAKTRERVWSMEPENTEYAGGELRNRMVDEVIRLPKGTYTVFFQTDDSHAYKSWENNPPFDQEHWGITVMGEGERFKMSMVDKDIHPKASDIIAQIVHVEDDEDISKEFRLDRTTRVRIYAIGEGSNREMFDYGWIEKSTSGDIIWEMTYGMTYHAGGARKNRMVNTTLTLEKGTYILHYVSDNSHSYNDWNEDPPDDPAMWGITIFMEE
jgi:hypothetical protein